ncbi:MAG: ATP-binding cassette domain-containing protein [Ignavibacteriales bacterium]|nr:ATP-binding cassette domain-containing protein [Ignavibacteriales bacterium]
MGLIDKKIKFQNIEKKFRKGVGRKDFHLSIDTLEIKPSEIVYFIGPNGSGKTTLLSIIQGSTKEEQGRVLLADLKSNKSIDLLKLEPHLRSKFIGYVPQDSEEVLINDMTIIEHVLCSFNRDNELVWFFPRMRLKQKVKSVLKRFNLGLENRLDELIGNLSGGEKQLLSFCLATTGNPRLLLLDEFTSALDPQMTIKVLNTAIEFLKSRDISTIVVTHRQNEAIQYADRIIVLHEGKPYKELKKSENNFNETFLKNVFNELYLSKSENF